MPNYQGDLNGSVGMLVASFDVMGLCDSWHRWRCTRCFANGVSLACFRRYQNLPSLIKDAASGDMSREPQPVTGLKTT